jgi:hypothetical protein
MNADKIPFPDKRPPMPLHSSFGTKPESTRQKALESRARVMEFASTIPKPLSKVKREVSFSNDQNQASSQVGQADVFVWFFSVCCLPSLPPHAQYQEPSQLEILAAKHMRNRALVSEIRNQLAI